MGLLRKDIAGFKRFIFFFIFSSQSIQGNLELSILQQVSERQRAREKDRYKCTSLPHLASKLPWRFARLARDVLRLELYTHCFEARQQQPWILSWIRRLTFPSEEKIPPLVELTSYITCKKMPIGQVEQAGFVDTEQPQQILSLSSWTFALK